MARSLKKIRDGSATEGIGALGRTAVEKSLVKYVYDITGSTTTISGVDANGNTLAYITSGDQIVEVFVNGVKQVEGVSNDYQALTGNSIVFTSAVAVGDVVEVQVYQPMQGILSSDDNGNIGISTDNPNKELTVNGNAHVGRNSSSIPNTSLASNLDFLQVGASTFIQAGADAQAFIKSNHYWNGSGTSYVNTSYGSTTVRLNENNDGKFQIETAPASGTGTLPRLIINNAGVVTKPYQPSFQAHKTSHLAISGPGQVEAGDWSTSYVSGGHNTGGHFNTTTGRFTAPIAGRYKFDANVMHGITSGDYQIWICVNGNQSNMIRSNSMQSTGGNWKQTTVTVLLNLQANDYISIFVRSSASETYAMYGSTTAAFTTCNGYLLG